MNVSSMIVCTIYVHYAEICSIDYATHNVPVPGKESFIRPRMLYGLSKDLSLDAPILPSCNSKARDLLLGKNHVHA